MNGDDVLASLPFLLLIAGAAFVLGLERRLRADERAWMVLGASIAGGAAAIAALLGGGPDGLGGLVRRDGASTFATIAVGMTAAITMLVLAGGRAYDAPPGARAAGLVVLCASRAVLMVPSGDLVVAVVRPPLLARPRPLPPPPRPQLPPPDRP